MCLLVTVICRIRTFVAEVLADLIEADTSDILFLNIRTTEPFGLQCTEVTVRVLGDSREYCQRGRNHYKYCVVCACIMVCDGVVYVC